MTNICTALAAFLLSIQKKAELAVAQAETGISLIEAVEADAFEVQLRLLTGGGEALRLARLMALEAVKMGIRPVELVAAVKQWQEGPWRTEVELRNLRRTILEELDARIAEQERLHPTNEEPADRGCV